MRSCNLFHFFSSEIDKLKIVSLYTLFIFVIFDCRYFCVKVSQLLLIDQKIPVD